MFQSKGAGLRRMVYLMIKELSPSADEVITVTSSRMKNLNSKADMYRANAIRVLSRIIDSTLLTQIKRYLKQFIVDKNPVAASATLPGLHDLFSSSTPRATSQCPRPSPQAEVLTPTYSTDAALHPVLLLWPLDTAT